MFGTPNVGSHIMQSVGAVMLVVLSLAVVVVGTVVDKLVVVDVEVGVLVVVVDAAVVVVVVVGAAQNPGK